MATNELHLPQRALKALQAIARQTGKTQDELLREAINELIAQYERKDQQTLRQQARGMWKDRTDLPDLEDLRRELDRVQG